MTEPHNHKDRPRGLIGGIGLTEVHVYAQRPAPDGKLSGCPHVHAVTDEGYFVLEGSGSVEFHDLSRGFWRLDLQPGDYVHFPPLVMHRLVSDGDLTILGMMGNAGLAEAGEARIYFGQAVDDDPAAYDRLMALPTRNGLDGALQRRDAAVDAYLHLLALWHDDRAEYDAELRRFFRVHCQAIASRADEFARQVEAGPLQWARLTQQRLAQLPELPSTSPTVQRNRRGDESALGMCGVLRPMLRLSDAVQTGS